jgi:hypothetical protein
MSKQAQRSGNGPSREDRQSGTRRQDASVELGDAHPHRGLEAQSEIEDIDQGDIPSGETHQAGGTRLDRAQKVGERKAQEGTAGAPPNEAGGPGTSPGTPLGKDRGG